MKYLRSIILGLSVVLLLQAGAFSAEMTASERAASILEKSTSFHWGRDCLVWLVHYPEELVGPWIDADPKTEGYTEEQRAQYRRSFKNQLRMSDSEPFLVTIYNFGSAPLKVSPLSDYLYMIDSDDNRVALVSYEKKLDQPISGIVQGLAFFPIQEGPFKLLFKGLGVRPEQVFAFPVFENRSDVAVKSPSTEVKDHVVELPLVDVDKKTSASRKVEKKHPVKEEVVAEVKKPVPSVEEPPAWLGPGPVLTPEKEEKPVLIAKSTDVSPEKSVEEKSPEKSRDVALKDFLSAWAKGDFEVMYKMLSSEMTSKQSLDEFSARAEKSPIRWNLSRGYKLTWLDPKRVKVSVAQKLVLIRVLQSEVLTMKIENGRWRFAW